MFIGPTSFQERYLGGAKKNKKRRFVVLLTESLCLTGTQEKTLLSTTILCKCSHDCIKLFRAITIDTFSWNRLFY